MRPSGVSRSPVARVAPSADVVVAVKAERYMSKTALAWALAHVVRPGDSVMLLAVLAGGGANKGGGQFNIVLNIIYPYLKSINNSVLERTVYN